MWLDPDQIPLAKALEAQYPIIRAEWAQLSLADFVPWVVPEAYQGRWWLFPLVAWNAAELGMAEAIARNRPRCPATVALLDRMPGVTSAAFSTLEPGAHIYPHVDHDHPVVRRVHLGIDVPDGACFRVGGETRRWSDGRCLAFDGQTLHEGANLGIRQRTILLVDVPSARIFDPLAPGNQEPS